MRRLLAFVLLMAGLAWAQVLSDGLVRLQPLQGREVPELYHRRLRTGELKQRVSFEDWAIEFAGKRAEVEMAEPIRLKVEDGPTLWAPRSQQQALADLCTPMPPQRPGANGYWFNQLLEEYRAAGWLLKLEDNTNTEMTFYLRQTPKEVADALVFVLAESGLGMEDTLEEGDFIQIRTCEKQERTPGLFNPPYRRYRVLLNLYRHDVGCKLNMKATVLSFQQRRQGYGSGWQADESPTIRQRLRQLTAETLTNIHYRDWRHVLRDYEDGYALPKGLSSPSEQRE